MTESSCPLCTQPKAILYHEARRAYHQCPDCQLVFVESQFHLSHSAEKAEYDLHQNDPDNEGYRRFLSRLAQPLIASLPPQQKGLDFGCGAGPTLSVLFENAGHQMTVYDPYYFPDERVFQHRYDFISATEVIEHVSKPREVFQQLFHLLKPGGKLGLMTKLVKNQEAFRTWHYIQDPTHICFYSRASFEYVAALFQAKLEILGADVILLTKPQSEVQNSLPT